MKFSFKESVLPVIILVVICVVMTAALVGTNALTEDKIVEAQLKISEESRMIVLPDADEFAEEGSYYVGTSGGSIVGYVFETSAKGYGGDINVMTGISENGDITGVVILDQAETPGLGANIIKESFTEQYQQSVPERSLEVVKNQAAGSGEVEAVTGATISTNAVTNAVNEAIEMYKEARGASE